MKSIGPDKSAPLDAIIIGAGFGGIGMAVALQKAGLGEFLILEKQHDFGGVWRDNTYPGAACDVPSHLYSFSFEPNPTWSRVFAAQAEIHQYLVRCAEKYKLRSKIKFGCEVASASFDEHRAVWTVTTAHGPVFQTRHLITATGQLSKPAHPKLEGLDLFEGRAFHSAHWDHAYDLSGKKVAVIGTGASAIQFVPAIADKVRELTVFQRSAAYILPRPDGAYAAWRKALFAKLPWTMKLHRARIYLQYETRAISFTRIKSLMQLAVGLPFKALLRRQVADRGLRERLTPDYPIGCKRILLSNDYLATMARPNVRVVTEGIRRVTPTGVETMDGRHHQADAIVYGTGFAATDFLAPMRITGRHGTDLNEAWRQGAQAYLGMTVPGFPNFFMLYGPNTNLGHSSIVYMLESQIAHVIRCFQAARKAGAQTVEVDADRYTRFNVRVQARLRATVWQGCKSWYVDQNGHNSTNWPGFTFSYRWLAKRASLGAYSFSSLAPSQTNVARIAEPTGLLETSMAAGLSGLLKMTFKAAIRPPVSVGTQRLVVDVLSRLMPVARRAAVTLERLAGLPVEVVKPSPENKAAKLVLYLHGGGFCVGSPRTHRGLTTRLAAASGMTVFVPDYRRAPEHPHPAALDDALACYRALLEQGRDPQDIVLCGDSAGGGLALMLALRLRDAAEPLPGGLMLLSPFLDTTLSGPSVTTQARRDPMLNVSWLRQAVSWYAADTPADQINAIASDLRGLPPMLIQVGDREVLLSDAVRLHERAQQAGVACQLEVYEGRWHVFQLQAGFLRSASQAISRLAAFARAGARAAVDEQTDAAPSRRHPPRASAAF